MENYNGGNGDLKVRVGYLLWNCWFLIAGYNFLYFVIWFQKNFRYLISKKLLVGVFVRYKCFAKKYFLFSRKYTPILLKKYFYFLMWEKINWSIVQFFKRLSRPSMNPPPIMRRPANAQAGRHFVQFAQSAFLSWGVHFSLLKCTSVLLPFCNFYYLL